MAVATSSSWGWARCWPRYVGAILLANVAQCSLGAGLASGGNTEVSRACLYYLSGAAAVSGVIGLVLCLALLPVGR